MVNSMDEYKRAYVVEQLEKYGYRDTDDKTYKELVNKLARLRVLEVKVESPHSSWF